MSSTTYGNRCSKTKKKPLLSKTHAKDRLAWAKKYESWTVPDWERVLFSDETLIQLVPNSGSQYVRRRTGKALKPECIISTVKHGGGNVKLWGCFGNYNPGTIIFIDEKLTGVLYRDILEKNMLPTAHRLIGQQFIFREDNGPQHAGEKRGCKIVKEWIKQNNVTRLDWPAQSPDLSSIEHLWNDLKKRVSQHKCLNLPRLREKIVEEFQNTNREFLAKLIQSMPARCKAVIRAKGAHKKY